MQNHLPDQKPQPNNTDKSLYNVDKADFTTTFANEENVPIAYTMPAQEISTFPTYIANHLSKHLAHHIVMKRGIKSNYDQDIKDVLKEIEVDLS